MRCALGAAPADPPYADWPSRHSTPSRSLFLRRLIAVMGGTAAAGATVGLVVRPNGHLDDDRSTLSLGASPIRCRAGVAGSRPQEVAVVATGRKNSPQKAAPTNSRRMGDGHI